MLPSMPILFTRESQDAFGNKTQPSTSFFSQIDKNQPIIRTTVSQIKLLVLYNFLKVTLLFKINIFNILMFIHFSLTFVACK